MFVKWGGLFVARVDRGCVLFEEDFCEKDGEHTSVVLRETFVHQRAVMMGQLENRVPIVSRFVRISNFGNKTNPYYTHDRLDLSRPPFKLQFYCCLVARTPHGIYFGDMMTAVVTSGEQGRLLAAICGSLQLVHTNKDSLAPLFFDFLI